MAILGLVLMVTERALRVVVSVSGSFCFSWLGTFWRTAEAKFASQLVLPLVL
jgi:hypothetical protein